MHFRPLRYHANEANQAGRFGKSSQSDAVGSRSERGVSTCAYICNVCFQKAEIK